MYRDGQGFTLVEVLVSLVIIIGIAAVAYQHHLNILYRNGGLVEIQKDLLLSESKFDIDYGYPELWLK